MKQLLIALLVFAAALAFAESPSAFPETSITLNLSPISLPGVKSTIAGAETDVLLAPSANLTVGETTLTSSAFVFAGGRGNYVVKPISTFIQNHSPNLNGYQFQVGLTASAGVVKPIGSVGASHWGERAGVFANYAVSGTSGLAVEAQWGNFPSVAHNTWTLAFGPNFHF